MVAYTRAYTYAPRSGLFIGAGLPRLDSSDERRVPPKEGFSAPYPERGRNPLRAAPTLRSG